MVEPSTRVTLMSTAEWPAMTALLSRASRIALIDRWDVLLRITPPTDSVDKLGCPLPVAQGRLRGHTDPTTGLTDKLCPQRGLLPYQQSRGKQPVAYQRGQQQAHDGAVNNISR